MKISVDSTVMRNSAGKFETISTNIQDVAKRIETASSELASGWQGDKSQEYCDAINQLAKNVIAHAQAVNAYAQSLKEAARLYDEVKGSTS